MKEHRFELKCKLRFALGIPKEGRVQFCYHNCEDYTYLGRNLKSINNVLNVHKLSFLKAATTSNCCSKNSDLALCDSHCNLGLVWTRLKAPFIILGRGSGGLVVSVLASYSNDLCSNLVKVSRKIVWKQWSKAHLKSYIKCSTWVSKAADIFFFIIWISCLHYLHKMTIKNSGSFRDYAQTMFSVIVRWCPVWPDWTIFKMYWEKILTTIAQIFGKFLGHFEMLRSKSKNCCDCFCATYGKIWDTLYSNIWSHWWCRRNSTRKFVLFGGFG